MEHKEYIRVCPGSDTAVLLIHGIVGTPLHFRELLPLIPGSWSVYNLLLDGHGAGVREFGATSMKKWKAQVSARVEEIIASHSKLLIIAHSMGTLFAIQEAIRFPDRIKALFLLNCPLRVRYPPSTLAMTIRTIMGCTDPAAKALGAACSVQLTKQLWRYIPWAPRFIELLAEIRAVRKLLPQLSTPTRCFQSAKDELVSMRACRELERNTIIRNMVLPDSGHFAYGPEDLRFLQAQLEEMLWEL